MLKIVFDLDDTLWGLNKKIAEQHTHIDYNKIITYSVFKNTLLTDEEKELLLFYYHNTTTFRGIKFYCTREQVQHLKSLGADIYINTHCCNKEIMISKINQITRKLGIPKSHICANILTDTPHKDKKIGKDVFIFVDDSPYNLSLSNAQYNMTLNCPWNTSKEGLQVLNNKYIYRFDTWEELYKYIIKLIQKKGV